MNLLKITFVLITFCLFFIPRAQAQLEKESPTHSSTFPKPTAVESKKELRPHIGLTVGTSSPEGSYDTAPMYGINVGYQPIIPFGLGLSVTRTENRAQGAADDLERTAVLLQGTYSLGGTQPLIKHSWVGVAAGPIFRRDGTDTGLVPAMLGFDIPLQEEADRTLSLGADAQYLMVSGAPDSLNINGVIKYWY